MNQIQKDEIRSIIIEGIKDGIANNQLEGYDSITDEEIDYLVEHVYTNYMNGSLNIYDILSSINSKTK